MSKPDVIPVGKIKNSRWSYLDKQGMRQFISLPYQIYKDKKNWIAPLELDTKSKLAPNHPFYEHGSTGSFYLAKDKNGKPVGRIALFKDNMFVNNKGVKYGTFGFPEFIEDIDVAQALVHKAEESAQSQNLDKIFGPFNLGTHESGGIKVTGFDIEPAFMMPDNHEYYAHFLEQSGLKKAQDLLAYRIKNKTGDKTIANLERVINIIEKRERKRVNIRPINLDNIEHEANLVVERYINDFANNWGHRGMSEAEKKAIIKGFKHLAMPELTYFLTINEKEEGFIFALPNTYQDALKTAGEIARPLRGTRIHGITQGLTFLANIKKAQKQARNPKIKKDMRLILMGTSQNSGLGSYLYHSLFQQKDKMGFNDARIYWVLESNPKVRSVLENKLGAEIDQVYRVYEKEV